MKRSSLALALALLVSTASAAAAQAPPDSTAGRSADSTTAHERGFFERMSDTRLRAYGFVFLPKVSYGQYQGVGFGGQLLHPLGWGKRRAAELDVEGEATTKSQGEVTASLNFGWGENRYYANTKVAFSNIKHRFYGIGPDTPDSAEDVFQRQSLLYYLELIRRVSGPMRVGVRGEFEESRMLESEPRGLFETQSFAGVEHSHVSGYGVLADWDTRDDRYWPTRGGYYQTFGVRFHDDVGSDYDFDVFNLDLRQFLPVRRNQVVALQAFLYAIDGEPPFWRLAELGGRSHSRGYRRGRYRDKVLLAFQAEHRFAVWRRFGLVGFAGLADVAPRLADMQLEHMRPTLGGGLRYRVGGSHHHVNARLDLAYGSELRLYFKLGESF